MDGLFFEIFLYRSISMNKNFFRFTPHYILIILTLADFFSARAQGNDNVEAFKAFVQNPGTIERLIVVQERPNMGFTNLFYLRMQSNAALLALSGGKSFIETLPKRDDLTKYLSVNSRYESNYWTKAQSTMYYWTDTGNQADKTTTNDAWYSVTSLHANIPALVCGGMGMLQLGQITWSGDKFICTNAAGLRVTGVIQRDSSNRVGKLKVVYAGAYSTNANISGNWNYDYSYGGCDVFPDFYPSYIHASSGQQTINYRFYALVLTNSLLPKKEYALDWKDFEDVHFEFWYTNGTRILSNHVGPNIISKKMAPRVGKLEKYRRPIIFTTFIVISLVFFILIFRANKQPK